MVIQLVVALTNVWWVVFVEGIVDNVWTVIVVSVTDSILTIAASTGGSRYRGSLPLSLGYNFVDVLLSTSQVNPKDSFAILMVVPGLKVWDPICISIKPVTGS